LVELAGKSNERGAAQFGWGSGLNCAAGQTNANTRFWRPPKPAHLSVCNAAKWRAAAICLVGHVVVVGAVVVITAACVRI